MRRIRLVLAVAAAMVAMATFAGPAFAGTDGSCIHMPMSPVAAVPVAITSIVLLSQIAVAISVAVVAAVAQTPTSAVRAPALEGSAQAAT